MKLLLRWAVTAAAVWAAVELVPGLTTDGRISTLFVVAAILGLVNALVRPLVQALACGLIALTLGLFLFVVNAALLWATSVAATSLGYGFHVDGFGAALLGSVVISVVSWTLSLLLKDGED